MKFAVQHYVEDSKLLDELLPLLNAWGKEAVPDGNFVMRTTQMLSLWKAGVLVLILARDETTSALKGFQIWWLYDPLYLQQKRAVSGPIFIEKESRGGHGDAFIHYGIQAVRILGAQDVILDWPVTLAPMKDALRHFGGKVIAFHIQLEN
jgi:hypothetical protein